VGGWTRRTAAPWRRACLSCIVWNNYLRQARATSRAEGEPASGGVGESSKAKKPAEWEHVCFVCVCVYVYVSCVVSYCMCVGSFIFTYIIAAPACAACWLLVLAWALRVLCVVGTFILCLPALPIEYALAPCWCEGRAAAAAQL
jgi:hypothetical protein